MQDAMAQLMILTSDEVFLRQLVIWLAAISVFVFVLGGAALGLAYTDPVRRRVDSVANVVANKPAERSKNALVQVLASIGPIAAFTLPQNELERNKIMIQLTQAGHRTPLALQTFYFIKTLLMVLLPLLVLVSSNWLPDLDTGDVFMYAVMASGLGMLLPNYVLGKMAAKRQRALTNAFPDALDLLVVCVESGLGLAAAIQRVSNELEVSHPDLAYELALVNAEIRVGVQREQALKNLAERTGLEDIRGLVGLLVQTMRFGTGVADALRVYSEEFRDKRTQKAEEVAAKMSTKLVFPLVLFMFPIFFIVAVGPAVLRIIDAFSGM